MFMNFFLSGIYMMYKIDVFFLSGIYMMYNIDVFLAFICSSVQAHSQTYCEYMQALQCKAEQSGNGCVSLPII